MSLPQVIEYQLKSSNATVENASIVTGFKSRKERADDISKKSLFSEGMLQMSHNLSDVEFKGFYSNIPMSHFSEDGTSTILTKPDEMANVDCRNIFQPLMEDEGNVLSEHADRRTKNAMALHAILEWYGSWRNWQKKILLAGIVNRFTRSQLKSLAIAVEPMFHRDFTSAVKKVYKIPKNARPDLFEDDKKTSVKKPISKKTAKPNEPIPIEAQSNPDVIKVLYERSESQTSQQTGSESVNELDEDNEVSSEQPSNSQEDSSSITSQPYALLTDVQPLSSYQLDGPSSEPPAHDLDTLSDKSMRAIKKALPKLLQKKIKISSKPGNKKTKKKKKRIIPNEVLNRILSASSTSSSLSGEKSYVLPSRKYPDRISSAQPNVSCFVSEANDLLGKMVTTKSQAGSDTQRMADPIRNKIPIPITQQTCKHEKFYDKDTKTVQVNSDKLKQLFNEQLEQIWQWIDSWPPHQCTRLLQTLIGTSDNQMVMYLAKCMKEKAMEAEPVANPTEMIADKHLLGIFSYLNPIDAFFCSLVCKRWYGVLQSDMFWKNKCKIVGLKYGIPELPHLLRESAGHNETLDWQKACIEIYEYLLLNVQPIPDHEIIEEQHSSSEGETEESDSLYTTYVPYWKVNPNLFKSKVQRSESPELIVQESSDGDIKESNLTTTPTSSCACLDVDLFADMQPWADVEVMTQIGQIFAVDFHVGNENKDHGEDWLIDHDMYPITKVQVLKGHTGAVYCVRCQGKRIFSGSLDKHVRLWDWNGECFGKFDSELKGGVNSIFAENDEKARTIYTASWDMSVGVWDSVNLTLTKKLTGHTGSVTQVSADEKYIVSCSHDSTIRVWDRRKYCCVSIIECHIGGVQCITLTKGLIISGGVDKKLCVSSASTGTVIKTFVGHKAPVTAVKVKHNLLASGDMDGIVILWSFTLIQTSEVEEVLKAHESQINTILFQDTHFFTASNDALVKEWDLVTMTCLRVLQGHTDGVTDIQITSKFIVTSSRDHNIRLWWFGGKENEEKNKNTLKKRK